MNQASLNLIAITIFTLVMTSLLGPLINLSPVVPAIAVAAILGLGTLDTFSLQGQGSTLLLDWVAGFSPEHRDRIIHHEAGHFLVAHLLEIPVTGYTLTAWEAFRAGQPGLGGVSFDLKELDTELSEGRLSAQRCDRYCTVWMAGIVAEDLKYGNAEGGGDDRQKLRLLLTTLKRPDGEIALKERTATFQAKTLLERHQDAYNALVEAMRRRAPVQECLDVISAS